jgi:hypothetical protein
VPLERPLDDANSIVVDRARVWIDDQDDARHRYPGVA